MRLFVDDSAAFNQGAGIGRYARNVLPAAARRLSGSTFRLVYAPSRPGKTPFHDGVLSAFPPDVEVMVRRLPLSRRRADQLWFRARLPLPPTLFMGQFDLAYSPDFTLPPTGKAPRLVTVHDLAFEVVPHVTPHGLRAFLEAVVPRQVRTATRIIAVSMATKRDLVERYNVDPDRVDVVPNGVDERFFDAPPLSPDEQRELKIPRDYLLLVGTLEPRKNHRGVFDALRAYAGRIDLPLVVAGSPGWDVEPIYEAARPLIESGRVVLLDYVPERLLPGLYASAAVVVYPSWYEGFGVPVAEGLAAGVPVVAGATPSLQETAGDYALYADPSQPEEIGARLLDALAAESRTDDARAARRRWARRLTWDNAGEKLASVFRRIVEDGR